MLNTVLLLTVLFFDMKNTLKLFFYIEVEIAIDHFINQENIPKNQPLSKEYHYMSQKI